MLGLNEFLFGVVVPGFVAGIGLALVWRPWQRGDAALRPAGGWLALFSGLALFAGYALLFESPPHPFGKRVPAGLDNLIWIAVLAGPLLLGERRLRGQVRIVPALLVATVLFGVLRAMLQHHWERGEAALWLVGLAAVLAMLTFAAERTNRTSSRATMPLVLLICATGLSLACGLTGSAKLGQTTGMLCAALGAAAILGAWHPGFRLGQADVVHAVTVLFGLGLCGRFFSELPDIDALLVAAGLPAAAAVRHWTRSRPPLQGAAATILAAAIPVGIAVARTMMAFDMGGEDEYYDY